MSSDEITKFEKSCQKILGLPKIRFVGVINNMGKKIAGNFKEGVTSFSLIRKIVECMFN